MKRHLEGVPKLNYNNALRDSARLDLQRLHSPAHYTAREHDPIADRELAEPLLREPVRYALSRQERAAALALADLATYQIVSRNIWAKQCTDLDSGSNPLPPAEPTFNEQREIWGRYEVFRQHAYSYARLLNDAEWMEFYATPTPAPAPEQDTAERTPVALAKEGAMRRSTKRRTWRDVAWPYIVETFKTGQYSTAKDFYRALESRTSADESPFAKGTGPNLHSLYVREISETVTLKTIQNAWAEIRATR